LDYQETLEYLFAQLPMFQRIGAAAYNKDLANTIALCDALGRPQDRLQFVHVAGTNGKGSVCHGLASVFMESGFRTGLFTSPHLVDFRERIQVNGQCVDREFVVDFVARHQAVIEAIKPSFFELSFGLALSYFQHMNTQMVVLETGMGGRLDSTNIVVPVCAAITNVGYDHMQYLGHTLKEIAGEKAGIAKSGIPLVLGHSKEEVQQVVARHAAQAGAQYVYAPQCFTARNNPWIWLEGQGLGMEIHHPLKADYQLDNTVTAAAIWQQLPPDWRKGPAHLKSGLERMQQNFPLRGRWQVVGTAPRVVLDVGHNADGLSAISRQLACESYDNLHIIIGLSADKEPSACAMLPKDGLYHLCRAKLPRAMELPVLENIIGQHGLRIQAKHLHVQDAYLHALAQAGTNDLILCMGSVFVVGELLEFLGQG
jgi:dihydrofolate synthase/folylpolyglutamate synthase